VLISSDLVDAMSSFDDREAMKIIQKELAPDLLPLAENQRLVVQRTDCHSERTIELQAQVDRRSCNSTL
jgi:hypothetical protein